MKIIRQTLYLIVDGMKILNHMSETIKKSLPIASESEWIGGIYEDQNLMFVYQFEICEDYEIINWRFDVSVRGREVDEFRLDGMTDRGIIKYLQYKIIRNEKN